MSTPNPTGMRHRSRAALPYVSVVALLLVALVSCSSGSDDDAAPESTTTTTSTSTPEGSSAPSTSETTTTTTSPSGPLVDLIERTAALAEGCCGGTADAPTFALSTGAEATLTTEAIIERRPQDPRRGLGEITSARVAGGSVLVSTVDGNDIVRFDCSSVRYTVTTSAPREAALDASAALSASAGCAEPSVSAPTECLGRDDDPPLCREGGH